MNETVIIVTALLDLGIILAAFMLGREWLYAAIVVNLLLISLFGAKLVPVFGFATNSGNVFYACVFFATYLLMEHGTVRDGVRAVWLGATAIIVFLCLMQLTLSLISVPETLTISDTMNLILNVAPRIAIASVIAYVIAQSLNVWAYGAWRERVGNAHWWLRAACIMIAAQLVDSVLFFSIGFFGTFDNEVVFQSLIAGYIIKVAVGMLAIPLLYASHYLRRDAALDFGQSVR